MNKKQIENFFLSQKFLSKVPFLLFLVILILPISILRVNYKVWLFFIAFYISYWAVKAFESYYYILISYLHLLNINQKDFKKSKIIKEDAKNLKLVIVLPYISTPYDVIEDSIISVLNNDFPYIKNLTIILGPEQRDQETTDNVYKVYEKYKNSWANIVVIPHALQPGDWKVKWANITYALKEYVRLYSPDEDNTIVITTDWDAKIEKNLFTSLAYQFLITEMPHNAIYQFTPVYSNNWTKSTFFARLIAIWTTFWQLAESQNPEFYRCFSTYSMSLKCLKKSDYWSRTSIVEDWLQYWRSYFAWDGVFRIVNVPAICKMDVVEEENLWKTIKSQYKQLRRWSWWCSDIEFVIPKFYKNKKIGIIEKIRKIWYLIFNHLFWSGWALTLFFIGYLPWVIDNLKNSIITLTIPLSVSLVFTIIFATIAFPSFLSILIMRKYTKFRKRDYIINIFQWLLIPTLTLTLFSVPAIESQLRYFFNWRIDDFEATKKMKRN